MFKKMEKSLMNFLLSYIPIICIISLDKRKKITVLFDVLFVSIPFIGPEIISFYQCDRRPLMSILKLLAFSNFKQEPKVYISIDDGRHVTKLMNIFCLAFLLYKVNRV